MSYTYNTTHEHKYKGDVTMYRNKKMLSAIAAVAVLSSGAIAFDVYKDGTIWAVKGGFDGQITSADIASAKKVDDNGIEYDPKVDENGAQKRVAGAPVVPATYLGGVQASQPLKLSPNGKGDALIYPAFRAGDGWSTEIVVRNTNKTAIVAKAVLYAADDSREIKDFNIYLSAHDAFRFNISKDGVITTRDGSYAKGVDPTYETDKVEFVKHEEETFEIAKLPEGVDAGYIVIYGMIQARNHSYHNNHEKLYQDYRMALDLCRDSDGDLLNNPSRNGIPMTQWRRAYVENGVVNGTLTLPSGVGAPNVDANCTDANDTARARTMESKRGNTPMWDHFKSPASDALFGSVRIQHEGDNRDLLLPATALENFTDDSVDQMMLWATGEYASMQDRRIYDNTATANPFSEYNTTGIQADARTFLVKKAYYVFNKDEKNIERNTLLVTQPLKRPLVQIGDPDGYWDNEGTAVSPWGDFKLQYRLYDDNEREYAEEAGLQHITSPYNTNPAEGYINELQVLRDLEEDKNIVKDEYFNNGTNGYADVDFYGNRNLGLPAIITQMTSSQVGGENQINWVYSTVVK
jgi:hypothetical protein